MTWLREVPRVVFQALADEVPRLTAEERSAGVTVGAIARFIKGGPWVTSQRASWDRAMRSKTPAIKINPVALAALGIGHVVVGKDNG
jgi:hypothetical protein